MFKLFATVFHIFEEVEAGAARTEQYGLTRLRQFITCSYAVGHRMGVAHGDAKYVEGVVELGVVGTEINEG